MHWYKTWVWWVIFRCQYTLTSNNQLRGCLNPSCLVLFSAVDAVAKHSSVIKTKWMHLGLPKAFVSSAGILNLPITSLPVDNFHDRTLWCKSTGINYNMHGWILCRYCATGWFWWISGLRAVTMWSSSSFTKRESYSRRNEKARPCVHSGITQRRKLAGVDIWLSDRKHRRHSVATWIRQLCASCTDWSWWPFIIHKTSNKKLPARRMTIIDYTIDCWHSGLEIIRWQLFCSQNGHHTLDSTCQWAAGLRWHDDMGTSSASLVLYQWNSHGNGGIVKETASYGKISCFF